LPEGRYEAKRGDARRRVTTKTEAASRVRSVLQSVKDRLQQPSGIKVNEATTRAHFLNPLLESLGYASIDDIEYEHYLPDGKTFLDYRLFVDGKARVAVEAKALDASLTDKDAAQVISYAAILGDEWAVLTNARQWDLYHAFAQAPLADKRILSVDLTNWTTDIEFDSVFEQLWLISREAFAGGEGPSSWMTTKKLDQLLRSSLTNPESPEVKVIRKRVEAAGIDVTTQQIASWFKARVEATQSPTPSAAAYPNAQGTPSISVADDAHRYIESPTSSSAEPSYWVVPAGRQGGFSAADHLKAWLDKGFWGFGEGTPGRKAMKVGDWAAFYAAKSHSVLAYAQIAGALNMLVAASEYPGPGVQTQPLYKVPLSGITWVEDPVVVDESTRASLDAFMGKDPAAGWSWLIQTTRRLTKKDFKRLTRT
jgi:hypothetical protein